MQEQDKYSRSLHAHISLGTDSDDRFMPDGYVQAFADMPGLILTEKLDGQNDCMAKKGLFARSHAAATDHPWDKPLKQRWEMIKNDLGDLELFGENMYGVHTIEYSKLESYFYIFRARIKDTWLSWEEVKFYAALFDFPTVPEIPIVKPLKDFINQKTNENVWLQSWLIANLGMKWEDYVQNRGTLGGWDDITNKPACEGLVIANTAEYKTNSGVLPVQWNEFNNLFKIVRPGHVKTDEHWTKNWKPAKLIDYDKYQWSSQSYLGVYKEPHICDRLYRDYEGMFKVGQKVSSQGGNKRLYGVAVAKHVIRWDSPRAYDEEDWLGGNWEGAGGRFESDDYQFTFINDDGTLKKPELIKENLERYCVDSFNITGRGKAIVTNLGFDDFASFFKAGEIFKYKEIEYSITGVENVLKKTEEGMVDFVAFLVKEVK